MYTYDKIVGNKRIIDYFTRSVLHRQVSHAYVIYAQPGMGKKLLANTYAKALLCESGNPEPCHACPSCRSFESGNHPDMHYVTSEKKSIGVDEIRHLNNEIIIKPYKGPYKIFIIDKAGTMTPSAQNALLKTLEEPPSYGIIMLLTSNLEVMLPTILSRSVILKLYPLSCAEVMNYMTDAAGIKASLAASCAEYAQGSIGRGLAIAGDEGFAAMRQRVLDILTRIKTSSGTEMFNFIHDLEEYKDSGREVLDIIYMWYRDALTARETLTGDFIVQRDRINDILAEARSCGVMELYERLDAAWRAGVGINYNVNFQSSLEMLMLKLFEKTIRRVTDDRHSGSAV